MFYKKFYNHSKIFLQIAEILWFNNYFTQGPLILISFDVESPIDSYGDDLAKTKAAGVKSRIGLKKSSIYLKNMKPNLPSFALAMLY